MAVSFGTVQVPVFARIGDKDFQLGELEVEVQGAPVEGQPDRVSIDADQLRTDLQSSFEQVHATTEIAADLETQAHGEGEFRNWPAGSETARLWQQYRQLQAMRDQLISLGVDPASLTRPVQPPIPGHAGPPATTGPSTTDSEGPS